MHESKTTTETADGQARAWFVEHGWKLPQDDLRSALEERGQTVDVIVGLLDEAADRKRAAVAEEARSSANGNGHGHAAPVPPRAPALGAIPPQNLEAEESVLGAMMISPITIGKVRDVLGDDGRDFYRDSHTIIYRAALALHDAGEPVDAITLAAELERRGELDRVGGRIRIHELSILVPASANAPHYAGIVHQAATLRSLRRFGGEAVQADGDPDEIIGRLREQLDAFEQRITVTEAPEAIDAGTFIFDEPTDPSAYRIWGAGTEIAWATGEGLMLVGPDGVGKTTLGQQIALCRAGLLPDVLGMTVAHDTRRVLYIAADRPRQAARSLRRMVTETDRDEISERMTVWRGPLPAMLNEDRTLLARLAKQYDAGTVVIDSLKDVAVDIATDEAGGRIASCFQHLIASDVELLVMHHPRKPGVEQTRKPREISDLYGSRLIYGVIGSVIMLWGDPGDTIVELRHLKQPNDDIGPWNLRHDHPRGRTTIERETDLVQAVLSAGTDGLTAQQAAAVVYQKADPSRNERERIRGKLERLVLNGSLVKHPGRTGGGKPGADTSIYLYNGPSEALQ